MKKAIILLSGGLDSATCLAMARDQGYACYALSFDYGQRHGGELDAAKRVAQDCGVIEHRVVSLSIDQWGGSALTDPTIAVPEYGQNDSIPITYVPARNTVFLSIALGWAEVIGCHDIFIGVSAVDYSGYPDCRPEFIRAFEHLAQLATKAGVEEGVKFKIHSPLVHLSKAETLAQGHALGLDYGLTVSCYQLSSQGEACGFCDSCVLRRQGFVQAGLEDPTKYIPKIRDA